MTACHRASPSPTTVVRPGVRIAPLLPFRAALLLLSAWALFLDPALSRAASAVPGKESADGLWIETEKEAAVKAARIGFDIERPHAYRLFELDEGRLEEFLSRAPMEDTEPSPEAQPVMTLPMPDGTFARFRVEESPILSADLAAEHPELRTYIGQGLDDPTATARLDRTPAGFHAIILSADGTVYIDPYQRGDTRHYISFRKSDIDQRPPFDCDVIEPAEKLREARILALPSGANRRTYRLAVTATGEYTTFLGSVAQAQAQITTTVNRVTGIYEREVAIRLNIVNFNIYANAATDPFPTGTVVDGALLNQNQTDLDTNVGAANYDIGHILSRNPPPGGGGLAQLGVVCGGSKARGGTSLPNPSGDAFDVDFVAHEMGHQFGGQHPFNGTTGNCGNPGQRIAGTAYEPGSGTTIMAYAGICGAENVQNNSDDYFHIISLQQITDYRDGGGACGVQAATGNSPPNVNAGPNFTIPTGTPFTLTATGSDPNGDPITFTWEQFDLGTASPPPNNADGPLFRSRRGTASPSRTFPRLQDILSGAPTPWEILPTVNRTLNFRVTARDNRAGGGGVNSSAMVVTVSGAPFRVASPNGGENLRTGCTVPVTWNVGGGNVAPNVAIDLSTDGGNNFSTLLASTPNDGSENVTLPCIGTSQGRIRVRAVGNIFFDISDANFTIQNVPPTIAASIVGGPVGSTCQRLVTFSATVTDDCQVNAANVTAGVTLLTGNATLGAPTINIVQTNTQTVTVTGSVLVSNLTSSPATVRLNVNAADTCGNVASSTQVANVVDNTPPVIACPAPITVECTSAGGTPASHPSLAPFFAGVSATDNCDPNPVITNNAPAFFNLGTTTVTFQARDASGNVSQCTSTVKVVDTTPPVISVQVAPTVLWPPNHKLVKIVAHVTVTDICDPNPTFVLTSITSNESDNGLGDGNTENDIQGAEFGTPDTEFQLRAERSGTGDGRIYTITYTASDMSGNTAQAIAFVRVPHDRR